MSTSSAKLKINFGFADDTSRDVELGPFDTDATLAATLKSRVKAFNPANVQNLYISDGGASCTQVNSATLTEVTRNPINLNDD